MVPHRGSRETEWGRILVSESDLGATCRGLWESVTGCVHKDYKEMNIEKKEDSRLRNLRRTRPLP